MTDTTAAVRRMTYAEIAAALHISGDAARQLVRRRGWHRTTGNHPSAVAVISVPEEELAAEAWREQRPTLPDESPPTPPYVSPTTPPTPPNADARAFQAALDAIREAHAGETTALQGRVEAAEKALHEERSRVDRMAQDLISATHELNTARQRADELQRERDRTEDTATTLREQLERLEVEVADAGQHAERIEADRRAAEAKLEAMREQLNGLEPDHAAAAELRKQVETLHQDVAAAEAVAAESRANLDAARRQAREAQAAAEAAQHAQVETETEAANLRADIEAAQRLVTVAQERAEALTKAETDRKGRGRWARLRAAWRGDSDAGC